MPRLFVAVWPAAAVVEELSGLERVDRPGVRWLGPEQWHVTLRFLGAVELDEAMARLATVSASAAVARIAGGIGRLGRGVLIAPVHGLDEVAAAARQAFDGLGEEDDRPFLGHLTLARLRNVPACSLVGGEPLQTSWEVDRVTLVQSDPGGRCTVVGEAPLSRPGSPR